MRYGRSFSMTRRIPERRNSERVNKVDTMYRYTSSVFADKWMENVRKK